MVTAYVVNLAHRADRWEVTKPLLADHGLDPVRTLSVHGPSEVTADQLARFSRDNTGSSTSLAAAIGCGLGHRRALQAGVDAGHDRFAVFEDDVLPHPQMGELMVDALGFLDRHAPRWDLLHLGVVHKRAPQRWRANMVRVVKASSATGYVVSRSGAQLLLSLSAPLEDGHSGAAIDHDMSWNFVPPEYRFAMNPTVCVQRRTYSDIAGRVADPSGVTFWGYSHGFTSFEEWSAPR